MLPNEPPEKVVYLTRPCRHERTEGRLCMMRISSYRYCLEDGKLVGRIWSRPTVVAPIEEDDARIVLRGACDEWGKDFCGTCCV